MKQPCAFLLILSLAISPAPVFSANSEASSQGVPAQAIKERPISSDSASPQPAERVRDLSNMPTDQFLDSSQTVLSVVGKAKDGRGTYTIVDAVGGASIDWAMRKLVLERLSQQDKKLYKAYLKIPTREQKDLALLNYFKAFSQEEQLVLQTTMRRKLIQNMTNEENEAYKQMSYREQIETLLSIYESIMGSQKTDTEKLAAIENLTKQLLPQYQTENPVQALELFLKEAAAKQPEIFENDKGLLGRFQRVIAQIDNLVVTVQKSKNRASVLDNIQRTLAVETASFKAWIEKYVELVKRVNSPEVSGDVDFSVLLSENPNPEIIATLLKDQNESEWLDEYIVDFRDIQDQLKLFDRFMNSNPMVRMLLYKQFHEEQAMRVKRWGLKRDALKKIIELNRDKGYQVELFVDGIRQKRAILPSLWDGKVCKVEIVKTALPVPAQAAPK